MKRIAVAVATFGVVGRSPEILVPFDVDMFIGG
jgi:hypothetical protein